MEIGILSLGVNVFMTIVMYFFKQHNDDMKSRLSKAEESINNFRDAYVKKDDFKEFKEELFVRLDEIKSSFRQEIQRLSK